ncbi:hypothetical protein [Agrococcus sp. BE272]|uniref:hypothetical protein n=1 Tax=Agrococcus sp. BE272 TaxID=2817727 RepID=UPI002855B178|nr:hypothetical protein [Agrococcus sp. BE272]MDR7233150.1 hypothetical protein [Agrococcus sp. BE272]
MPRSDAAALRAGRAALASGVVASALLALAGCVPLPPPLPTDEPTATSTLDADRCPSAMVDAHSRLLTGDPAATGEAMRARDVDHPLPLPLGGAQVLCATTLDDGSAAYTLLVLTGDAVPDQVRGAAVGLQVVEDRLGTGGGWTAHAPDFTSTVLLSRPGPELVATLEPGWAGPLWFMEAVAVLR